MMDFPLSDLLSPQSCYDFLLEALHPEGLKCPNGHSLEDARIYRYDHEPVLYYLCKRCGKTFNIYTDTVLKSTKHSPVNIVQILRGIAKGTSTAELARELDVDRKWLLALRHKLQDSAFRAVPKDPLQDKVVEADELYQNAGEKRRAASRSRRSAPPPGKQSQRPRNVGKRPPTCFGNRRAGDRTGSYDRCT